MSTSEPIVCKPTPWFLLRAVAMLLMFSVFAVLFYKDGTTGYREKNLEYYLHASFKTATDAFAEKTNAGNLTPEEWTAFAKEQTVGVPEDRSVLPKDTKFPIPWPEILTDFDQMKPLQSHLLWQEYSEEKKYSATPPEEPFSAKKIGEQIIVFYICLALALVTAFFLARTSSRSMRADDEGISTPKGAHIPYSDMKTLDLRKWETKGLALIDYEGTAGSGRARLDGLTYGGFKKEKGEPAEQLMRKIRGHFSGEIIEYTEVTETEDPVETKEDA
ncbi:MAG: hypothetical protein ACSHX7_05380 [Luteolibacter sp.]